VTLVRNLSLIFKDVQERSVQLWNSDRPRHALDWLASQLKEAHSRVRATRLARRGVFWAILLGSIPLVIVFALFMSGNADKAWPPLATFATALGATIVAIATLMRHFAQTDADRQRRIVETFSKAVEQLGSDKLEVRVGAIFALERLSKESPDDYWTVMEVLTASVRERMRYTTIMARLSERAYFLWLSAGRPEGRSEEFWGEAVRLERLEETPTDVAAVLTVIKRRSSENRQREVDRGWRIDLSGTYLRKANLTEFVLKAADLNGAHLEGAQLIEAHLEGANLSDAHLELANLREAHLEGAQLIEAHLEGASLGSAHLGGANLAAAHLEAAHLSDAHLEGAFLIEAHLEGAYLGDAHLQGATLNDAHLLAASLEDAHLEDAHLEGASLVLAVLKGAKLSGAHLEGADLSIPHLNPSEAECFEEYSGRKAKALWLTDDQLLEAFGDGETKLPEGIARPKHWPPQE
jgi:uncharacterized protein YjbI with pentapeptide repeats